MSLQVNLPTLEERFRARLERTLASAMEVLEATPERVLAVRYQTGTADPGPELARLQAAHATNPDAPGLPWVVLRHGKGKGKARAPDLELLLRAMKERGGHVLEEPVTDDTPAEYAAELAEWQEHYGRFRGFAEQAGDLLRARGATLRQESEEWPEAYPDALTVREALEVVRHELPGMARAAAARAEVVARLLVPEAERAAVLARETFVDGWPWPFSNGVAGWLTLEGTGWLTLYLLENAAGAVEHGSEWGEKWGLHRNHPLYMPEGARWKDVVAWVRPRLEKLLSPADLASLATRRNGKGEYESRQYYAVEVDGHPFTLAPFDLGLAYLAWTEVDRDRRRPVIAVDAGKVHHELLMGWTQAATAQALDFRQAEPSYVELLLPGQQQVSLGLPGEAHERLIEELRGWRSATGLRTYATILHLLSIRGARSGFVRWTLEEHLDVQGVPRKERREARLRAEAEEVELLTRMELAVKDGSGRTRERRPLFIVGSRHERLHGSKWKLDGMELQVNPLIWSGVRNMDSGKLGKNYGLAVESLPRLNPRTNPAALALGLILPMRFRLALNEGKDFHDMRGALVLRYAGLRFDRHNPGRTWGALGADLDVLQREGGVRRWEWRGDGKPSLENVLRFYVAEGHLDRLALGVTPVEAPARPLTGAELLTWRKHTGLSQRNAAKALGVSFSTVQRAEKAADELLGPALRDALRHALDHAREAAEPPEEP